MSRAFLPVFAILAFAITASAQPGRDQVAAQKLTSDVNEAITLSRKQDPIDAKRSLRDLLEQVRESQVLLSTQRAALVQRLQAQLNVVEEARRAKDVRDSRPLPRDLDRPKYKPAPDPTGGASSVAKNWIGPAKDAQNLHAELIRNREKGKLAVDLSVEKSGVLTDKEITFPPYWAALMKHRKDLIQPKLTEKEVAVLKTLNSVMSVDYNGDEFKAVIEHLQDKTKLSILIDEASLADTMTDYKDPVTLKIQKVTVRTLLKKILGDKGLTYIIKEGTIQVMTPKKAAEHTVVRTYQIDDLIEPSPQMQMMFGPFVAQAQMMQNAQQLMNLIQMTIEPNYWAPNGPGSMAFFPPTKSLLIRASAEMHYQMSSPGLFGGR